jgi:hypothetical protein
MLTRKLPVPILYLTADQVFPPTGQTSGDLFLEEEHLSGSTQSSFLDSPDCFFAGGFIFDQAGWKPQQNKKPFQGWNI